MIKHSIQKPPNWEKIQEVFPAVSWDKGLIVTWGDTYYCKTPISDDLICHEETHTRQQGDDIQAWWDRYYIDSEFRLAQELEAYINQVKYIQSHTEITTRNERRAKINHIAELLSSDIYGNLISYDKALELIKQ